MSEPSLLLRTELENQFKPQWARRGSRCWSMAELGADTFFIVEAIYESEAHKSARVFITCDVYDALRISDRYGPTQLEAYACFVTKNGQRAIEPVASALAGPADGQAVIELVSGKKLYVRCPPQHPEVPIGTPLLTRNA